jgi:hypothetical protein
MKERKLFVNIQNIVSTLVKELKSDVRSDLSDSRQNSVTGFCEQVNVRSINTECEKLQTS